MTVKELYDKLGEIMKNSPGCINDTIYIHILDEIEELKEVDKLDEEFDLNEEGKWITIS